MSLELAINNALTGLNVNQRALSVVSQNIANANTDGYTRKTLDQSAIYIGKEQLGSGVRIDDIVRKVDTYLQRSTRTQTSVASRTNVIDEYMARVQTLLGQPGEVNTLDEFMTTFFNSMQALAETPERISFREIAVDSGETLAREISSLALSMEDLRQQADDDIAESVQYLNQYLASLDKVNVAITNAAVLGNPISGLQDEQDILIQKIAEIIEVKVLVQPTTNEVYLYTANGVALLDEAAYELEYSKPYSIEAFIEGEELRPINVYRLDASGNRINPPETLVTGGESANVTTSLQQGRLKGLLELRDKDLPAMLEQLDQMAAVLRDSMNAIHNAGSSFPGANSYTGTREVRSSDVYDWEGEIRIAALDKAGKPIPSPYNNEANSGGVRPLLLDFAALDSGNGVGRPSVQTIIDEINNHFNPPTTKVELGNLNNIQLVANTDRLPNSGLNFDFDFDLENISGSGTEFFVTDITVLNSLGATVAANPTTTRPEFSITQYNTTAGSSSVTVTVSPQHKLLEGAIVYLEPPAAAVSGIAAAALGGYFTVSNVTANGFDITAGGIATATAATAGGGEVAYSSYDTVDAGEKGRTKDKGTITLDLSTASASTYYDISVNVGVRSVDDETGIAGIKTSTITFRVPNNKAALRNDRFDHITATGSATRHVPNDITPQMRAILVDENGAELPKDNNGQYRDGAGFLKLVGSSDYTIAIDDLGSKQLGATTVTPRVVGTNRAFAHFFELNNFFKSNQPTTTGDTRKNSAINMAVEERIMNDSNLISVGNLERSNQLSNPDADPIYTYQRNAGNNATAQQLAKLGISIQNFDAAGGLASSRQTLVGYTGEVLAYYAATASTAELKAKDNQILLDGFAQRLDSVVGVNVDEELSNMILFQNAYIASARIISTAQEMFDALLQAT
jgi:flagellar hook-associated protein FlgK